MKNTATVLATAVLGVVALGAAACNDDDAGTASSAPPAASPAASAGTPSTTPTPPASASPLSKPSTKPKVSGDQIIMIDPEGKKYTRKWVVRNAMMMAGMNGKAPAGFCEKSYAAGVKGGGKFPAGKLAFMDACEEGISLAN